MHYGWLKLRQRAYGPVYVWAADVEMVAVVYVPPDCDQSSVVYLHHDKIEVKEEAEWIVEQVDRIRDRMGAEAGAEQ